MQKKIERQKVVNECRSMMMEGMSLIPLESNLQKNYLVIISQTIQMMEVDNIWHLKTFKVGQSNPPTERHVHVLYRKLRNQ